MDVSSCWRPCTTPTKFVRRAKAKGKKLPEPEAEEDEGEVVDLMAALRESVEETQKRQKKRTRGKKAARKAS
jgi:non-homologous end joining protein Ku